MAMTATEQFWVSYCTTYSLLHHSMQSMATVVLKGATAAAAAAAAAAAVLESIYEL